MGQEKETTRTEAFSDGVFAIAVTLLILDIRVPRRSDVPGAVFDLRLRLLALWPSLLAYFMSFASILVMWVNHHRIFTIVRRVDQPFLLWNGLLLMFITFVPFPTALLSEYMTHGTHEELRLAAIVYSAHGFLISLAFTALWQYAIKRGRLLIPADKQVEVVRLARRYRWGPAAYIVGLLVALVSPWGGVGICLALVVFFAFSGLSGRN